MLRRSSAATRFAVTLALVLASAQGCSTPKSRGVDVEVGRHRVHLSVPEGWEHLDHGRQQLFRSDEAQISLADLGPATRDAMVRELRAAEGLWRAGRRRDAFQRVRELRAPALRFAPSPLRAKFWKPWTNVTYIPEAADSAAIGPAFEALIAGTATLPEATPERTLEYVLLLGANMRRREIARRDRRTIHGADWVDVELWDRVSHLDRARVAFAENNGNLLVLAIDRGVFENASPAFDSLLNSLELANDGPAEAPVP